MIFFFRIYSDTYRENFLDILEKLLPIRYLCLKLKKIKDLTSYMFRVYVCIHRAPALK